MKILVLSDTQIGAGATATPVRLQDQEQTLERIADLANERGVSVILHCGDVFERRNPSEAERLVWKRFALRVTQRLIVVAGNHDLRGTEGEIALDQHDEYYELIRTPTVVDLGACLLGCLPWTPVAHLLAAGASRERVNEDAVAGLLSIADGFAIDSRPSLLALHWWVEGAGGIDAALVSEPVLPIANLEALGFDAIFAGHVHVAEVLGPRVFSVGATNVSNFAEADLPHGVWILDTDDPGAPEFVPLPDRRFLTFDVDLFDPSDEFWSDETTQIVGAIELPVTDAVIRVRVKATEEQWRRVDVAAINGYLADAGAHTWTVVPDIVRTERARVEGVDESLAPADAVTLWLESQELDEAQRDGVLALLGRYVETA